MVSRESNGLRQRDTRPFYACIEAGGTKWNLAVACERSALLRTARVATTTPVATIGESLAFFDAARSALGPIAAIGIASFGPLDIDRASPNWGHILRTPKPGWTGADVVTPFTDALGCPAGLDTDVNGAALAEGLWGAARGCRSATYVTVGTGIGGGALIGGHTLRGHGHPEMGHIAVHRHPEDDFAGSCPFHGDCLEGVANGPAIKARWGCSLSELPEDHPGRAIIAYYLAQLAVGQLAMLASDRIVFGGGVLATPGLLARIRAEAERLAAGYFGTRDFDALIVPPALGDEAGVLGALALAMRVVGADTGA